MFKAFFPLRFLVGTAATAATSVAYTFAYQPEL
jgi:hypothetical protein